MFRSLFIVILLISSLFSVQLVALEVKDLYQASVVVHSQEKVQRERAIKSALKGVFLKVGGVESILSHEVLIKATKRASRYVSQYRYQRKDKQLMIVVSFNEDQINQLFEQAKLALWGSLRPQVLLWLVDEEGARRNIISSTADSIIPAQVNNFSIQRGLPIIMPLMDLADNEQVYVSDLWQYFPDQVEQASLRYFADTVVVMRVSDSTLLPEVEVSELSDADISTDLNTPTDNTAELSPIVSEQIDCSQPCDQQESEPLRALDWRVYTQGAIYTQKYQGVNKANLIKQGLSDITELIYRSYALLASTEHDFIIDVKNVTSLKEDSRLFDFLSDLSGVKTVTLIRAQGDVRRFKLDLTGSKSSLLASLKLNKKLSQQIAPQLDYASQGQQYSHRENSNSAFAERTHHGLKVIVLGEEDISAKEQDENVQANTVNDELNIGDISLSDISETNTLTSDLDADNALITSGEVSAKGPSPDLTKTKPVLKLTPNVPVFYWEQG
ncbi:MAG: DUF2066 domain-containing protein [Colwellia sp.]|nr:DUF2066 domain-containing protein [Colwellia sp.]